MEDLFSTNLPLQLTSFIGREREIADVKRLLGTTRLLMLTGSGGCGKTRLAIKVAADLRDEFPDGVWLVNLAPLSDPSLVAQTITSLFDLHESGDASITDILKNYLRTKNLLLVLDNCEHLIQACAQLCNETLHAAPDLKILATSREAMNIAGEKVFRVPSLSLPDPQQLPPVKSFSQYESLRLFIERAQAARPEFELQDANARTIAQICQRMDGMPLAIELAAARVNALPVEEIAARLDDCFRLLTTGSRTALPRYQTLRASIDWSYNLLSDAERALLRRLAVFAGGFTLDAVEGIGIEEDKNEVLDLLSRLVQKSLVVVKLDDKPRYHLLETIRQYAREKLVDAREAEPWQMRHLQFFTSLVEKAELGLKSAEQLEWLERLEAEHNNLRAALAWALEQRDVETGLQLASSLGRFWYLHGHLSEGNEWLKRMLSESENVSPGLRARAFCVSAALARVQRQLERANASGEQSLALYRQLGDKCGIADALNELGIAAHQGGDRARAVNLLQTSLNLYGEIGFTWGIARTSLWLADVQMRLGDVEKAAKLWSESLAFFRELGDTWGIAFALGGLGDTARYQRDYERATKLLRESLALHLNLNHKVDIPYLLEALALVAVALRDPCRAARLFGSAETLRQEINVPLWTSYQGDYAPFMAQARTDLGTESFAMAWEEGHTMTLEQAIEFALAEPDHGQRAKVSPQTAKEKFGGLTPRERQVAVLIAQGKSNPEIAEALVVSERTVTTHVSNILSKLGFASRTQIASWATAKRLTQ